MTGRTHLAHAAELAVRAREAVEDGDSRLAEACLEAIELELGVVLAAFAGGYTGRVA